MMKVAIWGFGLMNKVVIGLLVERGYDVVAVIGRHDIGSDAGEVAGLGKKIGVAITGPDGAVEVLQKTRPRICMYATKSDLVDIAGDLKTLAENKVNAITLGEEVLYPWNTSPELTQELDVLFRRNGVSFSGTGYQDPYWVNLPALLVGASANVERIILRSQYNVDDYGVVLHAAHGVGFDKEKFAATFSSPDAAAALMWNTTEAIAVRLGWTILKTTQVYKPMFTPKDITYRNGAASLSAGQINGLTAVVTTTAETRDGRTVVIEGHQIGQIYYDDLEDFTHCKTEGTPPLEVSCKKPDTVGITCATFVNRIEAVVAARAGYVPISELGPIL